MQRTNTLIVFDDKASLRESALDAVDVNGIVYLFPLTSKRSLIEEVYNTVKGKRSRVEVIHTTNAVNDSARGLRDKYIQFIARIAEKDLFQGKNLKEVFAIDDFASLWWFSLVAEKNTFKSDSFHRLAQFDAIIEVIKGKDVGSLLFCSRSGKLKQALEDFSIKRQLDFRSVPVPGWEGLSRKVRELQNLFYCKHLIILMYSVMRHLMRSLAVRKHTSPGADRRLRNGDLIIITYYPNIDVRAAQQGILKNGFFPSLQEGIESKGRKILWVAMSVESNTISFKESADFAERFVERGNAFYFLEEFSTLLHQLQSLMTIFFKGIRFLTIEKKIAAEHTFGDYNFYALVRDDWYASFAGDIGYQGAVYYRTFSTMLRNIHGAKCLYYLEMHGWEKALAAARNATVATSVLLGYQHSTVPVMLLNYFNDPSEIRNDGIFAMPQPDKIICNGELTRKYFRDCGWPENKLTVAEAIRFNHLKKSMSLASPDRKQDVILLILSISLENSSALLRISFEALGDSPMKIWIKPHPFLEVNKVFGFAGISNNDFPCKICHGPAAEFLKDARIVIAGESSVSVEAIGFGCEVIIVNTPEMINMSPLLGIETALARTANTPEELKHAVCDALQDNLDPVVRRAEAGKLINSFFYFNDSDVPERFLQLVL